MRQPSDEPCSISGYWEKHVQEGRGRFVVSGFSFQPPPELVQRLREAAAAANVPIADFAHNSRQREVWQKARSKRLPLRSRSSRKPSSKPMSSAALAAARFRRDCAGFAAEASGLHGRLFSCPDVTRTPMGSGGGYYIEWGVRVLHGRQS